jgi:hypothetical protein
MGELLMSNICYSYNEWKNDEYDETTVKDEEGKS